MVGAAVMAFVLYRIEEVQKSNSRWRSTNARVRTPLVAGGAWSQLARPGTAVVGAGLLGRGMDELAANDQIELIETDVVPTSRTAVICDAHDLPFADASMDGAVLQAVLEHVVDPYRCVAEGAPDAAPDRPGSRQSVLR